MIDRCDCPRCGSRSYERMSTYSHCPNCLYFEDYYESPQAQVVHAVRTEREMLGEDETEARDDELAEAS